MDSGDKIKVEGPPEEVEKAREQLEQQAQELIKKTSFAEIQVDAKYHKHIIGKGGSTGKNLRINFIEIELMSCVMTNSCASSDLCFFCFVFISVFSIWDFI